MLKISSHLLFALAAVQHVTANIIFINGTIITFNETTSSLEVVRNGELVVDGDRILSVTASCCNYQSLSEGVETIDVSGKIIVPGFVDAHHHLWQSLFKTLESNDSLASYFTLFGENSLAETVFTPQDSYISQIGGALESLNAGVTTIVDHAHGLWSNETADAILQADIDSGARVFYGFALHNLTNGWTIEAQMQKFAAMVDEGLYENSSTLLGLAFDFFFDSSDSLIQEVSSLATRSKVSFITSHYVGGTYLVDNSPEVLEAHGILDLNIPVILSHAAFITEQGRQVLREKNQYIATTPESELQLLFDTHNLTKLIQDQAALGVDTNFGFSADIITQARFWLQRLRGLNSEPASASGVWPATNPMSVNQAFLLATRQGGLALGRPDLGVIRPGAKADIVVIDTSSPSFLGWNDPVAAAILHSNIGDIEHVLVDGKFVKRDFQLTHPNRTSIFETFRNTAARVQPLWVSSPQPDFIGQRYMDSTEFVAVEQIDVLRGTDTGYGILQTNAEL